MENFKTTEPAATSQIVLEPEIREKSNEPQAISSIVDNDLEFLGDTCNFS